MILYESMIIRGCIKRQLMPLLKVKIIIATFSCLDPWKAWSGFASKAETLN